jgi:hypothetical protein
MYVFTFSIPAGIRYLSYDAMSLYGALVASNGLLFNTKEQAELFFNENKNEINELLKCYGTDRIYLQQIVLQIEKTFRIQI